MVQISQEVDGFAGVYKENGRYVVARTGTFSKSGAEVSEVAAALKEKIGIDIQAGSKSMGVADAQYDFEELLSVKRKVTGLLSEDHVSSVDISEKQNKVVIGVTSRKESFEDRISRSDAYPEDMIVVEKTKKAQYLSALNEDYTGTFKQGGLEIGYYSGFYLYSCTKSTTTKYYDGPSIEYGFLTNSHCTKVQGGVEGTQYYQDAQDGSTVVGVEENDPQYFTGGVCPSGQECRYSDAAFVYYRVYGFDYGGIHLTTNRARFDGSIQISGEVDISEPGGAAVGTEVDKVGKSSGWTYGDVTATCMHKDVGNTTILCQHVVDAGAENGDSGAPVFRSTGGGIPSNNDSVKYLGILWGGIPGSNTYYYSSHSQIEDELAKGYRVQD